MIMGDGDDGPIQKRGMTMMTTMMTIDQWTQQSNRWRTTMID